MHECLHDELIEVDVKARTNTSSMLPDSGGRLAGRKTEEG
jgi:hypothetical protein